MNRLREARSKRRKSQLKLYLETGITPCVISWIENGRWNPTEIQKKKLAKALGVKKNWLFSENERT
jgi:transcriptional regulator with XRE-family HTH domain